MLQTRSIPTDEFELTGETYDRPPSEVRAKIFICTTGRTGSWFLCRAMMHHGVGIPHEYFNARHIKVIAARSGVFGLQFGASLSMNPVARCEYFGALLARRTVNGIFSAKVHWAQYAPFLDNPEGDQFLQNSHFIYLNREDLLSQAISFYVAEETGVWGVDGTVRTSPGSKRDFFNRDRTDGYLKILAESDSNWRLFFARNGIKPYTISYERLKPNPSKIVKEIAEQFNLVLDPNIPDYFESEPDPVRDQNVPSRSEIRLQFLSGRRRIVPAGNRG